MRQILLLALPVLFLASCASIIHGTRDTLIVNSLEKGTRISIDGSIRGIDSATAEVKRGEYHVIKVEKDGFQTVTIET